jgi:hypothetical protein
MTPTQTHTTMLDIADVVVLNTDYNSTSLSIPAQTRGAIVWIYGGGFYEVEFFNKDHNTIDVIHINEKFLTKQ